MTQGTIHNDACEVRGMIGRRLRGLSAIVCMGIAWLGTGAVAGPEPPYDLVPLLPPGTFSNPQAMAVANDGSNRVFVGLYNDEVWSFNLADPEGTLTLVLAARHAAVTQYAEQSVLAIAFHPDFATNGYFYIYDVYRVGSGPGAQKVAQIQRYQLDPPTTATADVATRTDIYTYTAFNQAHLGSGLEFSPVDGYLYFTYGDGRDFCDTVEDPTNEHGKILRIDVDGGTPYAIPEDNPRADDPTLPEFYAMGFRNPYRIAFDPENGDLYLCDVGDRNREEVNLIRPNEHYGWPFWEGELCHRYDPPPNVDCETNGQLGNCTAYPAENYAFPVYAYPDFLPSPERDSVTGGYVYRGTKFPEFYGAFLFGDYEIGFIRYLYHDGTQATEVGTLIETPVGVMGFVNIEADPDGEPLILDQRQGTVYSLESTATPTPTPTPLPETSADPDWLKSK
jgi:glucose/arabinose dehydrogenase